MFDLCLTACRMRRQCLAFLCCGCVQKQLSRQRILCRSKSVQCLYSRNFCINQYRLASAVIWLPVWHWVPAPFLIDVYMINLQKFGSSMSCSLMMSNLCITSPTACSGQQTWPWCIQPLHYSHRQQESSVQYPSQASCQQAGLFLPWTRAVWQSL